MLVCGLAATGFGVAAQDASHPVQLSVDLSDAPKRVYHSTMVFPVKEGPMALVYPKWIPGEHGPNGPIVDVTGVHFRVNGQEVEWKRNSVDLFEFDLTVPSGATQMEATMDSLLTADTSNGEVPSASAKLAVLPWNLVVLYPKDTKSDDVMFHATLRVPSGWKFATALPRVKEEPNGAEFETVSLTTLVDSPVLTGQYMKTWDLSPGQTPSHKIDMAADSMAALSPSPEQIQALRQLIAEAGALFGVRHYRHYDFLLALSDQLVPNGLEHHESSDNRVPEKTWLDPDIFEMQTDLLPHEYFHSWNGKYRRPAGLATPNYQEPMKGDLLWVYEGLTQYYGTMLAARSGFWTPARLREDLASTAAYLNDWPGRTWRNLEDTAISAQILYGGRPENASWRRSVDYYDESTLIWLEADTIIRQETKGKKSLDDFCRRFHGGEGGAPKLIPYTLDDVVTAMNETAPYDWKKFFLDRVLTHGPGAPLNGIENSGWTLAFNDVMNEHQRADEDSNHTTNLQFSLGFTVHDPGGDDGSVILDVVPGSPAAKAGMAPDMRLLAVNGRRWSPDSLRDAIRAAKDSKEPIELLTENDSYFHTYSIDYHDGEKYPHLVPNGKADVLSEIAKMKAPAVAGPAK